MAHCPSQDWDRHIDELDAAADAQMRFYAQHGAAIERIVLGLLRSGIVCENDAALVTRAAAIAFLIYGEQE